MDKFGVVLALEGLAEAKQKWATAQREFQAGYDKTLNLLLHEAMKNFMSGAEVAKAARVERSQIRNRMKKAGLNPTEGKRALSEAAAKALNANAELLGIKPHEMDLTSPLAYLPMGEQLRKDLQRKTAPAVTDLPEFPETGDRELIFNETLRSPMDYMRAIETLEAVGYTVTSA